MFFDNDFRKSLYGNLPFALAKLYGFFRFLIVERANTIEEEHLGYDKEAWLIVSVRVLLDDEAVELVAIRLCNLELLLKEGLPSRR